MTKQKQSNDRSTTSSFVGNTQLNKIYQQNSTVRRDHRRVPELVHNFMQYLLENDYFNDTKIKDNLYIDICPYKCLRDNLDYCLWPSHHLIYCNPPWSGGNLKKWLNELIKFVEKKQGNTILLHKIDGMCNNYWFELLYNNKCVKAQRFLLRNNFCYSGYHTKKQNKGAPFGTALVLLQPNKCENDVMATGFVSYPKDLEEWRDSLDMKEYNELQNRQRQHMDMNADFFKSKQSEKNNEIEIIGKHDNKKYEMDETKTDNTITQMLRKEDDDEESICNDISLSNKESKPYKRLYEIFGDGIYSFLNVISNINEKDDIGDNDGSDIDLDINMKQKESEQYCQYECYANND